MLATIRKYLRASFSFKALLFAPILAAIFSAPIYYNYYIFDLHNTLPNIYIASVLCVISYFILFALPKTFALVFGLCTSFLWFYFVGLSFRFSEYPLMGIFAVGFIMLTFTLLIMGMLIFALPIYRFATIYLSTLIHPFYFDWFYLKALSAYSLFDGTGNQYLSLLLGVMLLYILLIARDTLAVKPLIIAVFVMGLFFNACIYNPFFQKKDKNTYLNRQSIQKDFYIANTHVPQNLRWQRANLGKMIGQNFAMIDEAIDKGKKIVVLPETAFPFALNLQPKILAALKKRSQKLFIITGALHDRKNKAGKIDTLNSLYVFAGGNMSIVDKKVLVPFGEFIPLPEPLRTKVSRVFFGTSHMLEVGNTQRRFIIDGIGLFEGAICYEATSNKLYKQPFDAMIVVSNNAWFAPSIEPALQRMIIKARLSILHNKAYVIHAVNGSKSYVLEN